MIAQYALTLNNKIIEDTIDGGISRIAPIINEMADEIKKCGWSVQKDELQESLSLRFWMEEKEINKIVDEQLVSRTKGIRGIIFNSMNKILGNDFKEQSTEMAKKMIKEKIENQLTKHIDNELSKLVGIDGIAVTKGNKSLCGNKDSNKMKMN